MNRTFGKKAPRLIKYGLGEVFWYVLEPLVTFFPFLFAQ
jgi:hypothetical protein